MNDYKPWYLSNGAWASLLQVLVGLASTYHVISAAQGQIIALDGPSLMVTLVTAALGVWSLYGRIVATKMIKLT